MDEQTNEHPESSPEPTRSEQLYLTFCAYQFGTISFLELLDAFEEILHLKTDPEQDES